MMMMMMMICRQSVVETERLHSSHVRMICLRYFFLEPLTPMGAQNSTPMTRRLLSRDYREKDGRTVRY